MIKLIKEQSRNSPKYNKIIKKILEDKEKFNTMAKVSAKILLNLVEDILDFAKIEAGKFSLAPAPFIIDELMREVSFIFTQQ